MTAACNSDPNEVIEKVVSAKANADKFDTFVNGTSTETVQLGSGDPTPVIRNVVRQVKADAEWAKQFIADAPSGDISLNNATAMGGNMPRTLAERFSEKVNVKDYGAVGDGVTNDTAAFSAAITAANGRVLVVPEGTYKITNILFATGVSFVDDRGTYAEKKPIYPYADAPIKSLDGFRKVAEVLPTSDSAKNFQGLTYNTKTGKIIAAHKNKADTYQEIHIVNKDTGEIEQTYTYTTLLHINTLTYCPSTDKIYALIGNTSTTGTVAVIDGDTMAVDETMQLQGGTLTGLAYDTSCKLFVGYVYSQGTQNQDFVIYDESFNIIKTISVPTRNEITNGICCHDGVITCITINFIRFVSLLGYIIKEINYKQSVEPEDIEYVGDGKFILNTNPLLLLYEYSPKLDTPVESIITVENSATTVSAANLNNIKTSGCYNVVNVDQSGSFPGDTTNGILDVVRVGQYIMQTFYRISQNFYNETYRRMFVDGAWKSWDRVDNYIGRTNRGFYWAGAGFVSGNKKTLSFTIPVQHSVFFSTLTLQFGDLYVRYNGNYLYNSSIVDSSLTTTLNIYNTGINFDITKTTDYCNDNNVCVAVQLLNVQIKFA